MRPTLVLPSSDTATRPRRTNERKLKPGSLRLPVLPDAAVDAEPRVPLLNPRPAARPSVEIGEEPPAMRPKLRLPDAAGAEWSAPQPLANMTEDPSAMTRPRLALPGAKPAVEPPAPLAQETARPSLVVPPAPDAGEAMNAPGQTRPRTVQPVDALTRLVDYDTQLRSTPVAEGNGRWKSALLGALAAAGQTSLQMLASGRSLDGSSLGAVLGGAIGGLAGGVVNPAWDERQRRQRDITKNQFDISRLIQQRKAQADLEGQQAQTELRKAQTESLLRPKQYKPHYFKQGGITYRSNEDGTASPFIDTNGNVLAPDHEKPYTLPQLSEDGVTVTQLQYDPQTRTYKPIQVGEKPVITKRVQRINPETGMTEAQTAADADRDAARADIKEHRAATREQQKENEKGRNRRAGASNSIAFKRLQEDIRRTNLKDKVLRRDKMNAYAQQMEVTSEDAEVELLRAGVRIID